MYISPFHTKLSQALASSEEDEVVLIVKFKVAVESQPAELVVLYVYVPLSV